MAGKVVRRRGRRMISLEEMPLEAYQAIGPFEADVYQVFDPLKSVEKRNAVGGTSPQSVKNQLAGIRRTPVVGKTKSQSLQDFEKIKQKEFKSCLLFCPECEAQVQWLLEPKLVRSSSVRIAVWIWK